MVSRERREHPEDAVSPVVGMILVLGISIVGIAAILYWGLPAIDEMKANVEHRSLESQFAEFDATVKELVAGTTEKTAKRWQPTLNRGSINVVNESEGWVYAVIPYSATRAHSYVFGDLDDGDNRIVIESRDGNTTIAAAALVYAHRINGTTSSEALVVSTTSPTITPMTAVPWTNAEEKLFYLFDSSGNPANFANATIRLRIYDDQTKVAEAWYVPSGRIDYRLEAGVSPKIVSQNNGAVITGNGDTYTLVNAPPIPPAANSSGITRHFARAVVINGSASFAGTDRFNILVSLYSTFTLGTYDCTQSSRSDCVEAVQVFAYGTYKDAWRSYLLNTGRSYTFSQYTTTVDGVDVTYLDDREGWMGYTLLQSTVQLTGS